MFILTFSSLFSQRLIYSFHPLLPTHCSIPSVSVAFMRNGRLAGTMQSGVKDLTTKLVVNENTVFQADSIAKPAFAALLMKYRENNSLDLGADFNLTHQLEIA